MSRSVVQRHGVYNKEMYFVRRVVTHWLYDIIFDKLVICYYCVRRSSTFDIWYHRDNFSPLSRLGEVIPSLIGIISHYSP